ncbi:MAG TPA: GtrA family protein [Cyclobacteriaceae bacterium]|nr:GtrA family protein [Cyclobacteriaceae bacterium]
MEEIIYKLLKFSAVGFSGLIIDFGLTWLLKERFSVNKYLANSAGFTLAATSNYFLNRIWTFENHALNITEQYTSFFIIALIGLIITNGMIYLLNQKLNWGFYFSKLIAIGLVIIWNFTMNYIYTFA